MTISEDFLAARGGKLRIGSRASPLAMAQAHLVAEKLKTAHPALALDNALEIISFTTSGDKHYGNLADVGGKGLFVKELEEALMAGEIDFAVHSAKDMATILPKGLAIIAVLEREDPRDILILTGGYTNKDSEATLADIPRGARVGTSSLRRATQIKWQRPDVTIVPFRGNVQTRLKKLEDGVADVTLLAFAGIKRLEMHPLPGQPLSPIEMLPAVAQGALAIECRENDEELHALFAPLHHEPSAACIAAERAMLRLLDGSCRTPIAGLAETIKPGELTLTARVLSDDGSHCAHYQISGEADNAVLIGEEVGQKLKAMRSGD